jgi:hypothetical protein
VRRKVRLIGDWTVDFWFRRDIAELGQLGHPPPLDEPAPPSPAPPVAVDVADETSAVDTRLR